MRGSIGHLGDVYEAMREIAESLPSKAPQRTALAELAVKIAEFEGTDANLLGFWPQAVQP